MTILRVKGGPPAFFWAKSYLFCYLKRHAKIQNRSHSTRTIEHFLKLVVVDGRMDGPTDMGTYRAAIAAKKVTLLSNYN